MYTDIIHLQNLPWAAEWDDVREYFAPIPIPEGGVVIYGGKKGDTFVAFNTSEDAQKALQKDGGQIYEATVKLTLSSTEEMARAKASILKKCLVQRNRTGETILCDSQCSSCGNVRKFKNATQVNQVLHPEEENRKAVGSEVREEVSEDYQRHSPPYEQSGKLTHRDSHLYGRRASTYTESGNSSVRERYVASSYYTPYGQFRGETAPRAASVSCPPEPGSRGVTSSFSSDHCFSDENQSTGMESFGSGAVQRNGGNWYDASAHHPMYGRMRHFRGGAVSGPKQRHRGQTIHQRSFDSRRRRPY